MEMHIVSICILPWIVHYQICHLCYVSTNTILKHFLKDSFGLFCTFLWWFSLNNLIVI